MLLTNDVTRRRLLQFVLRRLQSTCLYIELLATKTFYLLFSNFCNLKNSNFNICLLGWSTVLIDDCSDASVHNLVKRNSYFVVNTPDVCQAKLIDLYSVSLVDSMGE